MSMELNSKVCALEPEVVGSEAIRDAIESCFADANDAPERALELLTPEDLAAIEDGAADSDLPPEVETAEEISLKNGVYHEIRRKLNERFQIPPHEIAFIHEADTPAKKATLFKDVNRGRVRVLIGSTSKLGTGVNVQKRLVALHHVDEPWKPAELEQREGRILRQGNIYPEAFIFHYVTERSFDGYMLQTLESKARFISQIMAGEVTARTAEDVGDMVLTVAQVKAIASGNPMVQRRIELEVKLVKLDRLRAAYYNNRAAMRADLEELPERITAQGIELAGHVAAIKSRLPLEEDSFRITLKKNLGDAETTAFDKRERAGAHLRFLADLLMDRIRRGAGGASLSEDVGSYRGFKVFIHVSGNSRFANHSTLFNYNAEIRLRAPEGVTAYVAQIGESNVGITQSIDYQLRHLEDRLEQARSGFEMLKARLTTVQAEVDKPWAHAAEYHHLRRQYDETGAALQKEGVEIESNTTFSAGDDEAESEGAEEEAHSETYTDAPMEAFSDDALSGHHNPYTGLEDWTIVAPEDCEDGYGFDESDQPESLTSRALAFDFAAEDVAPSADEVDIFFKPPDAADEPCEASETAAPETARGEEEVLNQRSGNNSLATLALNNTNEKRHAVKSKKLTKLENTAQSAFLWN